MELIKNYIRTKQIIFHFENENIISIEISSNITITKDELNYLNNLTYTDITEIINDVVYYKKLVSEYADIIFKHEATIQQLEYKLKNK
jgi:hypothetical protein